MRNERGYTLVITLLMITLIFVVAMTLIANSINVAKQNKITESNYLATQIAEMGVVYVQEKLKSLEDIKNKDDEEIKTAILDIGEKKIDDSEDDRSFIVDMIDVKRNDDNSKITGFTLKITGKSGDRTTTIEATLEIPSENVPTDGGGSSEGSNNSGNPSGSNTDSESSKVVPPKGVTPEENNVFDEELKPKKNNLITVVEGLAILNKGLHFNQSGASLYATALKASQTFRMQQDTYLFVCQNAEFNGGVEFSGNNSGNNHEVHGNICGDATFKSEVSLNNNGILVVGGDLHAQQSISANKNDSRIEVFGDFTIDSSKTVDSDLKVCVRGEITGVQANKINVSNATSCDQVGPGVWKMPNLEKKSSGPYSCNSFCTAPSSPGSGGDGTSSPPTDSSGETGDHKKPGTIINIVDVEYK